MAPTPSRADSIKWNTSYTAAVSQAKTQQTLVMVDVYTDWCEWCKKLDTDVYPNAAVVQAVAQFAPVKVNAEKEGTQLAARYNIQGFPTILFLQPDGTLVSQIGGYEPAAQFASDINQVALDQKDLPVLQAEVKANPADLDSATKLALLDARRGQTDAAMALADTLETAGLSAKLGPLYDAIGDSLANQQKFPDAIVAYKKTLADSTASADLLNAHIGLVNCYAQQNDMTNVKAQLQAIIATPGVKAEMKQHAKDLLAQVSSSAPATPTPTQ
jgi:thioredoxin-related protein